jgi:hypothetical protein
VARSRTQGSQREGRLVAPPRRVQQGLSESSHRNIWPIWTTA